MKLETFFEKFELFAGAPNAVERFRRFVLELAVRGRLVDQVETDGSASQVFTHDSEHQPSTFEGAPRYAVPDSWVWVRFCAVGERRLGKMLDQRRNRGQLKPYLRNTNVQWMRFELNDVKEMRFEPNELDEFALRRGDLLICEGGEPGRCSIWNCDDQEMYFQKAVHRVRPRPGILPEYLAINLRVDAANGTLSHFFTGATIKHLTGKSLSEYSIPLPPLAEQKRIVAKVDELMALCDRLEAQEKDRETRHAALARASLARFTAAPTPANLNYLFHKSYTITPADLRKTILTLAVEGRLVPQMMDEESAAASLRRLGLEVDDMSLNNLHADDDFLPPGWIRVQFEAVAAVSGGVTLGRKLRDRKKITLPYLRVANVKRGELDLAVIKTVTIAEDEIDRYALRENDLPKCISIALLFSDCDSLDDEIDRYALRENDLLMTEGGDWDKVGRAAIWKADLPLCLHQNHVFRARLRSVELNPVWFERYFNSPRGRAYFEGASKQTTNLASINMRQVRGCPVPVPPLAEQRRIGAKVDELMALVDQLETQLCASRAAGQKLLEALIAELTTKSESCQSNMPSGLSATSRHRSQQAASSMSSCSRI